MDADKVQSADDILAAADARLNAPAEPAAPATPPPSGDGDPGDEDAGRGSRDVAPDGEPSGRREEPTFEVDGERFTASQIRQMRTNSQRVSEAERATEAARYLLQNPQEYERVRRENGLASPANASPAAPEPTRPAGPDPLNNAEAWKLARYHQYVDHLARNGQSATPQQIMAAVEADHREARNDRLVEMINEDRQARERQAQETERQQAQWRQDQEAVQIARTLGPLFERYPEAATPHGQEEVEARIIRAVHLGQPVDYEGIVRGVHDRGRATIKDYTQRKQNLATGTGPAVNRGGSAQGTRQKLQDKLPADVSSLSLYAEMKERGEA